VSSFIIERQKDRIFFLFSSSCCASSKLAFMNELRASSMGTAEKSMGRSSVQFTTPFSRRFLRQGVKPLLVHF
jgi:hypothetical protein